MGADASRCENVWVMKWVSAEDVGADTRAKFRVGSHVCQGCRAGSNDFLGIALTFGETCEVDLFSRNLTSLTQKRTGMGRGGGVW